MKKEAGDMPVQEKRKKKSGNLFFGIFFFLFIGGYLFFFTSKVWMPDTGEARKRTPISEMLEWNNREIRLLRWDYSEEQRLMEVELGIVNRQFDGRNAYQFSAMESSGKILEVETIIDEPEWIILQIKDIPKRFREISLRLEQPENENAGILRLYTNRNDVDRVASIENRTMKEYRMARADAEIQGYQINIEKNRAAISEEEETITSIHDEINRLNSKEAYQTEQEKENTNALITDAKWKAESAKQRIQNYEQEIAEYEKRIQNLLDSKERMAQGLE